MLAALLLDCESVISDLFLPFFFKFLMQRLIVTLKIMAYIASDYIKVVVHKST